ncbi:MAG: VanZ family protein [Opitutales bacterium]
MVDGSIPRLRWKLLHGFFGALILAVSSIPGSDLPAVTDLISDKVLHFGEYAVLGFLGGWAYLIAGRRIWVLLLFGLGFAGLDEWWQSTIPGRQSDFADFLADAAGHCIGALAGAFMVKRSR